ncbi:Putative ATP-dependent DNA helicase [Minicystis rosea]|nr:Putative ATP-dependent DNA helicase [Minicystis rosea]
MVSAGAATRFPETPARRPLDSSYPAGSMFHPVVRAWFERRFAGPSAVQERAFPVIAGGADTLVTAPTGSGKTLAAFLSCLDRLVTDACAGALGDHTYVVYISPLKALSNDVQKNLDLPVTEITALAAELGYPLSPGAIRTAVRTGDTTAKERLKAGKRPPHVLVTTPESLFILLTSRSGRAALAHVRTVIVDEIHAVAPDKRGAHLSLSIERLEDLVVQAGGPRPQRIGLSATVRPIEVAARLLVGSRGALPAVIDAGQRRDLDLAIEVPRDELGAVCTNEQWAELYDRLASLAREHRSTLVFVNTRRLAERLALHLGERLGPEVVAAHHGSLSRARRLLAEERLKAGTLRVVVATASLELGIDVGAIELTCVVGSPRSVSTALQRIGRSGHTLGATPKGRFFPLTRDQLLECAAIVRAARRGVMDAIALRDAPLDILAQQIVAVAACEDRGEDEVFDLVRRGAQYADLPRATFDDVVTMVSEGVSDRRGRAGALVHRDGVNKRLRGRRGARLAALTSGGAIPDNANYDVLELPAGDKVGTVDEDFAIDSSAGDVFLLGNASWRIHRVEMGKVWVEDAKGMAPTVPFWFGEAPARTRELSDEVGELREAVAARIKNGEAVADTIAWLCEACALDEPGARLLRDYVAAAVAALGAVPTTTTVVAERFFDEAGGQQLVVHAPFGGRINRAWGMALRKRFCRSFDFELQAAATDDGVLLSLGPQHSFPLEAILELLSPDGLREVLEQAALQAPMFGTRFRWNATRSLSLLRFRGGKRVPPALLRMRSDDLLAAVFPQQVGCQDNHGGGPIEAPDHPLVNETLRDCLTELMDAEGLAAVLRRLHTGEIRFVAAETPEPSVLSHEILNANPYAFLDDAPLEERRARMVSVRRGLPAEMVERDGALDPEAIATVVRETQPDVRTADELHDLLLDLGALPDREGIAARLDRFFAELRETRRAARLVGDGDALWVAAERSAQAAAIWPARSFQPAIVDPGGAREIDRDLALAEVIRGRLAIAGPITAAELARDLAVAEDDAGIALARLESEGAVLRGRFRSGALGAAGIEWCDRRLLARIHRLTVAGLRRAIEPAAPADLMRFLLSWQGVRGARHHGRAGVLRAIEQLQGFELAAGAWENEVLPARVPGYDPAWLDELCLSGEVVWGRLAARDAGTTPTKAAPITLARRRDLPWLLTARDAKDGEEGLSEAARAVLASLRSMGASFFDELVGVALPSRAEVEDGLWELVGAGRVTGDGFAGLRALIEKSARWNDGFKVGRFRGGAPKAATGRWALLRAPVVPDAAAALEAQARQYLRRYGVITKDLLAREAHAPPWRDLVRVYRHLEMRGEIRGGRMVAGFVGEQFALPEALEALRAIRREAKTEDVVRLSACDPLNLVGIITPGARVPAHLANSVTYRDGVPVEPSAEAPAIALREAG